MFSPQEVDGLRLFLGKTPSLRNVALRAPCMHAGQFASLDEVVAHYVQSPPAGVGHSELAHGSRGHAERLPIRLSAAEARDIVAFLQTLSGAVVESSALGEIQYWRAPNGIGVRVQ